jgi:hypothetical protein
MSSRATQMDLQNTLWNLCGIGQEFPHPKCILRVGALRPTTFYLLLAKNCLIAWSIKLFNNPNHHGFQYNA